MKSKDPKSKLNKTEKLLYDIFRLCDGTVWCEDWLEFQEGFKNILMKYNYNLWKIYFGVPSRRVWRKKCRKTWKKYLDFQKKAKARQKDSKHYYIKNRAYKVKLK